MDHNYQWHLKTVYRDQNRGLRQLFVVFMVIAEISNGIVGNICNEWRCSKRFWDSIGRDVEGQIEHKIN